MENMQLCDMAAVQLYEMSAVLCYLNVLQLIGDWSSAVVWRCISSTVVSDGSWTVVRDGNFAI